jgi:hypothetical protein
LEVLFSPGKSPFVILQSIISPLRFRLRRRSLHSRRYLPRARQRNIDGSVIQKRTPLPGRIELACRALVF